MSCSPCQLARYGGAKGDAYAEEDCIKTLEEMSRREDIGDIDVRGFMLSDGRGKKRVKKGGKAISSIGNGY